MTAGSGHPPPQTPVLGPAGGAECAGAPAFDAVKTGNVQVLAHCVGTARCARTPLAEKSCAADDCIRCSVHARLESVAHRIEVVNVTQRQRRRGGDMFANCVPASTHVVDSL
jgi:hypothetical protein